MSTTRLTFESPVLKLRITEQDEPFSAEIDGWSFVEALGPPTSFYEGEPYWSYQVKCGRETLPSEDPGNEYIHGCHLVRQLDLVWTYATGLPMSPPGFDVFLEPVNPPPGWMSNGAAVIPDRDWKILQSRDSYRHTNITMPRLPLEVGLNALKAYYQTDELTFQLCSYHFGALTTTEPDLHFLLLAQALELARELLPGSDTAAKQNGLSPFIRSKLRRGLNWLFEASHRRRQTRHSITKTPVVGLHPPLEETEERDFIHDSLLVIQAVAATRLGLPLVVNYNGTMIEAA